MMLRHSAIIESCWLIVLKNAERVGITYFDLRHFTTGQKAAFGDALASNPWRANSKRRNCAESVN